MIETIKEKFHKSDKLVLSMFVVMFIVLLIRTYFIVNIEDFLGSYKYFTPDSYDWLVNGIYYFRDNSISYRNMGLPLLIAISDYLNSLWLLPYFNALTYWLLIISGYLIAKTSTKNRNIGIFFGIFLFLNFEFSDLSKYILADLHAITFLSLGYYFILKKNFRWAFLMLGVSALFQNFAFFIVPIWIIIWMLEANGLSSNKMKSRQYWVDQIKIGVTGSIMFLLPNLPIMIYKFAEFGSPLYSEVEQLSLIEPNFDSIPYYTIGLIDMFTLSVAILMILGFISTLLKKSKNRYFYALSGLLISIFVWLILYNWNDKRFLFYFTPFVIVYASLGFHKIANLKYRSQHLKTLVLSIIVFTTLYWAYIPSSSFFASNEVQILHDLKIAFTSRFENKKGAIITLEYDFKERSYRELLAESSYLGDFYKRKELQSPNNTYSIYEDLIEERYSSENDTLCLVDEEQVEFYSFKSIFWIETNEDPKKALEISYECE